MVIVLILAASAISLITGWFIRNQLLKRQVDKLQKQNDEIHSLHMNLQHELQTYRQKIYEFQVENKELATKLRTTEKSSEELGKQSDEKKKFKSEMAKLVAEKNELTEEITKYQNENFDLSEKINILTRDLELAQKQNKAMKQDTSIFRDQESKLQKEIAQLKGDIGRLKLALVERKRQDVKSGGQSVTDVPVPEFTAPDMPAGRSESQSTERFEPQLHSANSKKKPKEDTSSTGMRMLKEFEENLRKPKPKKDV